jgi:hypothetical protein
MARSTDSFKQFDYSLRPSKQVERKAMVEILLSLSKAGYAIPDYGYLGFGSVYYVDFVMFHKYLFINKMVCVEWGDIEKRMRFNKPFKFIKLKLIPLSSYIPSIRATERLLAWLDYDRSLDPEMLRDIDGMCSRLSRKSVFMVTVDARSRLPKDQFDVDKLPVADRENLVVNTYREWFAEYVAKQIDSETASRAHVAPLFYEIIIERIKRTLALRNLKFIQFFNCFYRDGAPMLTVGGMIGTDEEEESLRKAHIFDHEFVRTNEDPLVISVPPLTLREKQWLDSRLYGKLKKSKLSFELDEDLLQNYCKFYKEYPTYLETLL